MRAGGVWLDVGVGLMTGLVATKVTESGQHALSALTSQRIKGHESRVRPGPPYRLAVQETATTLRPKPGLERLGQMCMAFHYGSGMAWGTVYCRMRRAAGMESLGAGIGVGTSMLWRRIGWLAGAAEPLYSTAERAWKVSLLAAKR